MALELRQNLKLEQRLVLTPQLQMAIKLLQLSRLELVSKIQQELMENPALEEATEISGEDSQEVLTAEPLVADGNAGDAFSAESDPIQTGPEDIDWSSYLNEYTASGKYRLEFEQKEAPNYEAFVPLKESLSDHLRWQLRLSSLSDAEYAAGECIVGNVNSDGYLELDIEEIAEQCQQPQDVVQRVLKIVQDFDPPGVCARNLKECLLIQVHRLGLDDSIVCEIIANHLHHVEVKRYNAICSTLGAKMEDVVAAVEIIRGLEPKPGRPYNTDQPHYITPDIYVSKVDDEFVILLNDDGLPRLRISGLFRDGADQLQTASEGARQYMQEKMRSATWLIRSIHQRQKTIYRVMESILKLQREFFEKGMAFLKPMILRDVAEDIGMHESTISRVTTNKYVHTPHGIFELKFFFNNSIQRMDGDVVASAVVAQKIRQLVDSEDPKKPLSDEKIAELLKKSNINLARRTVGKYRDMLKILPSTHRKRI
jgi:RNA polymerase sigma-54 factor